MVTYSKNGAKAVGGAAVQVRVLAILPVVLLAAWPSSAALASTIQDALYLPGGSRNTQCLEGRPDRRAVQPGSPVAKQAMRRPAISPRIVLTPREFAARLSPDQLGMDLSETVPLAPALKVRANWFDASEQEVRDNPFTLVGNRAGLVNVNQAEVRGEEVWLTVGAGRREATQSGGFQTAAP